MLSAKIHPFFSMKCLGAGAALALLALSFAGCGGEEAPEVTQIAALPPTATPAPPAATRPPAPTSTPVVTPTPTETPIPPTPSATPLPPTPTATPTPVEMVEVDIASLKRFPELQYSFSGSQPGDKGPEAVLMDGEPVVEGSTQTAALWTAPAPAHFEVTVPALGEAFQMTRIEVTDPGGDKSLHECEVFIQQPGIPEWQHPPGVMSLRMQQAPGMKSEEGKSVFAFKPIRASAIRIVIPKGGDGTPDQVSVTDIDVIGTAPKGSLP